MHRDTLPTPAVPVGLARFAVLVLAGILFLGMPVQAQTTTPTQAKPQSGGLPQAQSVPVQAQPQAQPQPQAQRPPAQAAGTAGGRGAVQVGRNRRPSYAACNRISHARGLRGGARRRFLVRCKLGYDRPRTGQPQAPVRQP